MAFGLVVLGSVAILLAVLAIWIDRVVLDPSGYSSTSSEILQQPAVQRAVAANLTDQVYARVNVAQELAKALPKAAKPLAVPAAAALHGYAITAATQLLASDHAQLLWLRANRIAHAQLLLLVNGGTARLNTRGGVIAIDTGPMLDQLAGRLGITPPASLASSRIVVMRSDQLSTVQMLVRLLDTLKWVLPVLALLLYAAAVWAARDHRRQAVSSCGWGMIAAAVVVLLARAVGGSYLVDSLTELPTNRGAAQAAWSVLTSDLADITRTLLLAGVIAVVWAWVSGRGQRARIVRRAFAPYARLEPARVWIVFTGCVLVLIEWAPTSAFRRLVPVVILTALAGIGVEAIRRQTMAEFPDAMSGTLTSGLRTRFEHLRRPQP